MDNVVFMRDRRAEQLSTTLAGYLEGEDLPVAMTAIALLCRGLTDTMEDVESMDPVSHEEFKDDLLALICEYVLR